jgi:hypothetical protein
LVAVDEPMVASMSCWSAMASPFRSQRVAAELVLAYQVVRREAPADRTRDPVPEDVQARLAVALNLVPLAGIALSTRPARCGQGSFRDGSGCSASPSSAVLLVSVGLSPWVDLLFPAWILLLSIDIMRTGLRGSRGEGGTAIGAPA